MSTPSISAVPVSTVAQAMPLPPQGGRAQQAVAAVDAPAQQTAAADVQRAAQPQAAAPQPATREALEQALEDVRNAIQPVASELAFSIDDDSGRVLVKIVDSQTDEVIKQIPSEEMLRISKALDKLQGLLVKQEV